MKNKKPDCTKIIGLSVVAVKGWNTDKRIKKNIEPVYILFSDGETYLLLEEQDYYSYHDCSSSARWLTFRKDKIVWKEIFENVSGQFPDANEDL